MDNNVKIWSIKGNRLIITGCYDYCSRNISTVLLWRGIFRDKGFCSVFMTQVNCDGNTGYCLISLLLILPCVCVCVAGGVGKEQYFQMQNSFYELLCNREKSFIKYFIM